MIESSFLKLEDQNGPRNDREDFPEAVITNQQAITVIQEVELYKIIYIPDIPYRKIGDQTLHLHVLIPDAEEEDVKSYPCVVYIKGSAWMHQNLAGNIPQIAQLARRGFVVIEVEYRSAEDNSFPAQREDVLEAISFLKTNAAGFFIDPDNMFVWGDSSGAHIALFTGLKLNTDDVLPQINAIVAYFPPSNLLVMNQDPTAATTGDADSPEGRLMGGVAVNDDPQKAIWISPYYYFKKGVEYPPLFLAHGTKDRVVPFSQSDQLANRLQEEGFDFEFYALKDADHGGWQFWTDDMNDKLQRFLKAHLK